MIQSTRNQDCDAVELKRFIGRLGAGLAVLLIGQMATSIWWAATITARVNYLERTQSRMVDRLENMQHQPVVKP